MNKLKCFIRLTRLNRPIPTFTLLWPGLCGLSLSWIAPIQPISLSDMGLFAVGSLIMRGIADTANDMVDADIDRQVARTANRPMANGELTDVQAWIFLAAQMTVASLLYAQLHQPAQTVAACSLIPLAAYPYVKRCVRYPQIFLAATINLALPMGYCHAANCSLLLAPSFVHLFYSGFMCWTLIYDTAYATMDVNHGDKEANVHSTARYLDTDRSLSIFLHGCVLASSVCFCLGGYMLASSTDSIQQFLFYFCPSILVYQLSGHLNNHFLLPGRSCSVNRFFFVSCISMSLVFCGLMAFRLKQIKRLTGKKE